MGHSAGSWGLGSTNGPSVPLISGGGVWAAGMGQLHGTRSVSGTQEGGSAEKVVLRPPPPRFYRGLRFYAKLGFPHYCRCKETPPFWLWMPLIQ